MLDPDRFQKYLKEKAGGALERILCYLPKMSIPIERIDVSDGWVLTCRDKDGGHLSLSDIVWSKENLVCRILGSGNLFASGESLSPSISEGIMPYSNEESLVEEEQEIEEVSILDHIKELLLNAQKHGCWKPGRGGVSQHVSQSNTALDGIPISQVLSCGIDLWKNLEIDDDELMEIVIRDISYQIQKQKDHEEQHDCIEVQEFRSPVNHWGSNSIKSSTSTDEEPLTKQRRFNPRVDPTLLYLDLRGMTFNLEEFMFRVEPKERYSVFDPVFEGIGTLIIRNTSIKMRVECRKERIMKLGTEVPVPVLQLQELDIGLDRVKFKFMETGADWILNKVMSGFSKNVTDILHNTLKEEIVSQIHLALEHLNAFIEVNPDLILKVLGITMDDLEENIVWV